MLTLALPCAVPSPAVRGRACASGRGGVESRTAESSDLASPISSSPTPSRIRASAVCGVASSLHGHGLRASFFAGPGRATACSLSRVVNGNGYGRVVARPEPRGSRLCALARRTPTARRYVAVSVHLDAQRSALNLVLVRVLGLQLPVPLACRMAVRHLFNA